MSHTLAPLPGEPGYIGIFPGETGSGTGIFTGVLPVLKENTADRLLYYGDRARVIYNLYAEGSPINILEWPGFRQFLKDSRAAPLSVVDVRGYAGAVNVSKVEFDFEFRGTFPVRIGELWPDPWPQRYNGEGFRLDREAVYYYGQDAFPRSTFPSIVGAIASTPEKIGDAVELVLEYTGKAAGTVVQGAADSVTGGTKLILSLLFVAVIAVAVWAVSESLFD